MKRILNNKIYKYVACACVVLSCFTACKKDYLTFDIYEGVVDEDDIWENDRFARSVLNVAYNGLQYRYDLGEGALLADASDEAVISQPNNPVLTMTNGTWGPGNVFDDRYTALYTALRTTNLFLEKAPKSAILPVSDINPLRGQAFFLRAFYHFELMKRYGRIVLATRVFDKDENLDLPRNTVDEVVSLIKNDCDSAAAYIPAIWNGTGTTTSNGENWDTGNRGRATKAAALALKSRVLLYYASPQYNPLQDIQRWKDAAEAAKAVIDLNKHSLVTTANYPRLFNYSNAATLYNAEVIFATTAVNTNAIESNNAPVGFNGGKGRTNPTQELVDAFDMSNGKERLDPTSNYSDNNPYANRDARLALFIVTNGSQYKTGSLTRTVETFEGGADKIDKPTDKIFATKTGYYLRKFTSDAVTFAGSTGLVSQRRPWVLFRYAEILLNYAEALNESDGDVTAIYSAINAVRRRANPSFPLLAGLSKLERTNRIRKERQVELCFEEHRFFDVRRWKLGEQVFNKPVSGMKISKLANNSYTYQRVTVENRVFDPRNYLYPISQNELNRSPKLEQNPHY